MAVLHGDLKTQIISVAFPMLGGLGVGFFGCLLSYSKQLKRRLGCRTKKTRLAKAVATVGSFAFSLFSLIPLVLGAPVNIVNVVRAGTLLPANAFFSQLLGLRPLLRDDYIGTLVTISGVVCFVMFVGPPGEAMTQEEFLHQIRHPAPVTFIVVLLAIFFGSAGWMAAHRTDRAASRLLALAVSVVISCSIAAMDVATKGWAAVLHHSRERHSSEPPFLESPLFWVAFFIQACFFGVSKWGMIFGCSRCDVLLFVPLNIVLNIFFAVAAGMVVLGEASQVPSIKSWFGILASWACVVAGIMMLVSGPADVKDSPLQGRRKPSAQDSQSDSEDADGGDSSDTVDRAASNCLDTFDGSGSAKMRMGLAGTLWLFISQHSAVDRLNGTFIGAANARAWWRNTILGPLRKRQEPGRLSRRRLTCWLRGVGLEPPPDPGSDSSDSDRSESSAA